MTVPSRFIPRDAALSDPVCYDMSGTALKSSETCNVAVTDDIRSTELQNIVLRGFHYRSSRCARVATVFMLSFMTRYSKRDISS
jgi:hypothetical protein